VRGASERDAVISELYNSYHANGFITEDEALACFVEHRIPLSLIDAITDHLLSMGIVFKNGDRQDGMGDEIYDRTRTDYEAIFREVRQISPGLFLLIEYIKAAKAPQHREWRMLMPQAQNGNQYARDRLFDMYLRVVVKIALKHHKESRYEIEDIIQVGSMGLLQAIKAYDFSKHGSFVSYMPLWIAQYISRAISDLARPIRIPVHMIENMRTVDRALAVLQYRSADEPTITDLANACQMSDDMVEKILTYSKRVESIEQFRSIGEDGFCSYEIEDLSEPSIEEIIERIDLRRITNDVLGTLKCRDEQVIRSRLGFDDGRVKTLEEVGGIYGVTRERIRQIESKAVKKLKRHSGLKEFEGY